MRYMHNPHYQITLTSPSSVSEVFEDRQLDQAQIIREENNYDTALLTFGNKPALYPKFPSGSTVKVEVKDGSAAYVTPPLFNGMVLYPVYGFGSVSKITFQCVGTGYPLNMMNCAEEYGTQSRHFTLANNLNSLYAVITDADYGLIPKWVNKYMGGSTDSGYSINIDNIDVIAGEIIYQSFPYKPINKCLDDLCDLVTALNSGSAGPHWIVDTDGKLRVKLIGNSQTGWTKYYGGTDNTAGQATLTNGVDFLDGSFEPLGKEANCIVYYGAWRRPGSGDATEANHAQWGTDAGTITYTDDGTNHIVGTYGVKGNNSAAGGVNFTYPITLDAAWNFNSFTDFNTPCMNFYLLRSAAISSAQVALITGGTFPNLDGFYYDIPTTDLTDTGQFYHFSFPIGPYANLQGQGKGFKWTKQNNGDWANINYVMLMFGSGNAVYVTVDGFHFGGAAVCRIAREEFPNEVASARGTLGQTGTRSLLTGDAASGQKIVAVVDGSLFAIGNVITLSDDSNSENCQIDNVTSNNLTMHTNLSHTYHTAQRAIVTRTANPIRTKVITDNTGKDDSLKASDDSGLMAQLAKAELLRLSKATISGKFTTSMIPDILPGQYVYIDKDYRIARLIQTIQPKPNGYRTAFEVTDDLTNSHTRLRYEDQNRLYASMRPEWQDKQASSIKVGALDIRVARLETAYNL